jgi:hypothetical protein
MRLHQQPPALVTAAKDPEQSLQDRHYDQVLDQERPRPPSGNGHEFQIMLRMKTDQHHLLEDRAS